MDALGAPAAWKNLGCLLLRVRIVRMQSMDGSLPKDYSELMNLGGGFVYCLFAGASRRTQYRGARSPRRETMPERGSRRTDAERDQKERD